MKKGYAESNEELSRYILRYAHVTGVCEEEQIAYEVRWTKGDR